MKTFTLLILLITFLCFQSSVFAESTESVELPEVSEETKEATEFIPTRLLVQKKASEHTVLDGEWKVDITIFNVGEEPAYNIDLNDGFYASDIFQTLSGTPNQKFEVLRGGEQVSHSYTLSGKKIGEFETTQTIVSFAEANDAEATRITSRSNAIPDVKVVSQKEFDRINAKKWSAPIVFALLVFLPVILPALLHLYSNNEVERIIDASKN